MALTKKVSKKTVTFDSEGEMVDMISKAAARKVNNQASDSDEDSKDTERVEISEETIDYLIHAVGDCQRGAQVYWGENDNGEHSSLKDFYKQLGHHFTSLAEEAVKTEGPPAPHTLQGRKILDDLAREAKDLIDRIPNKAKSSAESKARTRATKFRSTEKKKVDSGQKKRVGSTDALASAAKHQRRK